MGLLDKLKNVFFEEIEFEEQLEKPTNLAKKIEIPKKKTNIIVENKEEPIKEDRVENRENKHDEVAVSSPVTQQIDQNEKNSNRLAMMFEEDDFVLEESTSKQSAKEIVRETVEKKSLYPPKKEDSYTESIKKDNSVYGHSKSIYNTKDKKIFTPSPIISPIYGVLDKNYKKEEVIAKKEIRISSSVRNKVDLDSIRNKAFGEINEEIDSKTPPAKDKEKDFNVYDVNKNKPSVKGVTLNDADEYYKELGLAYNEDYQDRAIDNSVKPKNDNKDEDNLFDLIESMYDKEE